MSRARIKPRIKDPGVPINTDGMTDRTVDAYGHPREGESSKHPLARADAARRDNADNAANESPPPSPQPQVPRKRPQIVTTAQVLESARTGRPLLGPQAGRGVPAKSKVSKVSKPSTVTKAGTVSKPSTASKVKAKDKGKGKGKAVVRTPAGKENEPPQTQAQTQAKPKPKVKSKTKTKPKQEPEPVAKQEPEQEPTAEQLQPQPEVAPTKAQIEDIESEMVRDSFLPRD